MTRVQLHGARKLNTRRPAGPRGGRVQLHSNHRCTRLMESERLGFDAEIMFQLYLTDETQ